MGASKSKTFQTSGGPPFPEFITLHNGDQVKQMIDNRETFVLLVKRPVHENPNVRVQENALRQALSPKNMVPIYVISIEDLRKNAQMHAFMNEADQIPFSLKEKPILFRWNQGVIRLRCGFDIYTLVGGGFGGIVEYVRGDWANMKPPGC